MAKMYTCDEVAERYKVKVITVWDWIRQRKLNAIKLGREYRISEDDICGKQHARFRDECILAQNNGIKLYVLVQNAGGLIKGTKDIYNPTIRTLDELHKWKNPRLFVMKRKVADLFEFWNGQKNIVLLDPNMFACKDWKNLSQQLIDSKAWIDFSQGCDIRIMTKEKAEYIKQMKIKQIHFAWDRYQDKDNIVPKFKMFQKLTGWNRGKMTVYVLCGFNTTLEQDLDRIYTLRDLGYAPYVMIYDKYKLKKRDQLKRMQRWVNSRYAFMACERFEDYTG